MKLIITALLLLIAFSLESGVAAAPSGSRVLIVTGIDYPGHKWRETTPVLVEALTNDAGLEVDVLEDPYRLDVTDLTPYRAVLLHFMNWERPDPNDRSKENLRSFVERGGGMVMVHFACGAFRDWPEFENLAGRIYDRTNTHDPRGPFTVHVTHTNHAVTRGITTSFKVDDELYTCLTGNKPVELLASARSRVTKRDHPMAFVHQYGKGRVFQTPLGHDVKALRSGETLNLIRQGTLWAMGLEAAPKRPRSQPNSTIQQFNASTAPFFPFCIDWHDSKKRSFEQQAAMLEQLGYDGVGHIWLDNVAERIKSLDGANLKLFQITMTVDVGPKKKPYDDRFKEVLQLVNGRRVQFCLLVNGMTPSDPFVDPHAVRILREMSDLAKGTDAQLLLYPHVASWIERIEDSIRVADKVDRPNVGVMFNVCHWLRVDKSRDYKPLLKQAMPRLWAVSINGADNLDEKPGWSRYIQPLGAGNFDMATFLRNLKDLGYTGPIGLQCYGIGGDAQEHLTRSMAAWKKYTAQK
jgi:uncharacterized protein